MRISKDKKSIELDVPMDSTVYAFYTKCNDLCTYKRLEFKTKFPEAKCRWDSICHTVPWKIVPMEVSLRNIEEIVTHWNEYIFATEAQAENALNEFRKNRIQKLRDAGFNIDDDGHLV